MERAKELFLEYCGNQYFMDLDGVGHEYAAYHVPKETEELWAQEYISGFLESETQGKEALRAYSAVTELARKDRRADVWEKCLYYPLRAGHLDDVTILFMLPGSFRMAERAAEKRGISRQDAGAYLQELNEYSRQVRERADQGTLTRAADYVMQEFSDPVYVAGYLNDLKMKWTRLS
nr:hypothetical protein [Lachnospiraceae bacterium]